MKVVFHIDELDRWPRVLVNAWNMTTDYIESGTPYTIEVVANGDAVQGFSRATSPSFPSMKALVDRGVEFVACQNSLNGNSLAPEDLFEFVGIVKAAVVEIAARQAEGYAYIRP